MFLYLLSSHCSGHVLKHTANTSNDGPNLFLCGKEGKGLMVYTYILPES